MPGAFRSPAPQRPCGIRAYKIPARHSWGLFHLRLASSPVSALASRLVTIAQTAFSDSRSLETRFLSGFYERRPTWNGSSDPKTCALRSSSKTCDRRIRPTTDNQFACRRAPRNKKTLAIRSGSLDGGSRPSCSGAQPSARRVHSLEEVIKRFECEIST